MRPWLSKSERVRKSGNPCRDLTHQHNRVLGLEVQKYCTQGDKVTAQASVSFSDTDWYNRVIKGMFTFCRNLLCSSDEKVEYLLTVNESQQSGIASVDVGQGGWDSSGHVVCHG